MLPNPKLSRLGEGSVRCCRIEIVLSAVYPQHSALARIEHSEMIRPVPLLA